MLSLIPVMASEERTRKSGSRAGERVVLGSVVLLGALMRFPFLTVHSLWNDELASWLRSSYPDLATVLRQGVLTEAHPPAFHFFLFYWMRWVGDSEFWLRFPSAVFGTLSIGVIYCLGKQLASGRVGLIAASMMAVLWFPIHYSLECRSYSALLLFSMLSMLAWLKLIARTAQPRCNRASWIGLYWVLGWITAYLHYFGFLFVGLQGLGMGLWALGERRRLLFFLRLYAVLGLGLALWTPGFVHQLGIGGPGWIPAPRWYAFYETLRFFFNKSGLLVGVVLLLYLAALWPWIRNKPQERGTTEQPRRTLSPSVVLLVWLLCPFAVGYVLSLVLDPLLTHRNLIVSLPAAYLLCAISIVRLPWKLRYQHALVALFLATALVDLIAYRRYYSTSQKEQFREAVQVVVHRAKSHPDAWTAGCVYGNQYLDYYFAHLGSAQRIQSRLCTQDQGAALQEAMQQSQSKYLWLIAAHRESDPALLEDLKTRHKLLHHWSFQAAQVDLYQITSP